MKTARIAFLGGIAIIVVCALWLGGHARELRDLNHLKTAGDIENFAASYGYSVVKGEVNGQKTRLLVSRGLLAPLFGMGRTYEFVIDSEGEITAVARSRHGI